MLWDDLYEAFANSEHVVMGRRLKPFCAYYYFWLRAIESPLLAGGKTSIEDFDLASKICSSPYGGAQRAIRSPKFPKLYYGWKLATTPSKDKIESVFRAYLDDFTSPPQRQTDGTTVGTKRETFPYPIWLVSGLMMHGNMTPAQAWMTPLGEAEWYMSGFDLNRGQNPHVLTGHDREFIAEMKRAGVKPVKKEEAP